MAFLENFEGNELVINCMCGCDEGINLTVNNEDENMYAIMTYTNGKFYSEQHYGFIWKLRKIWAIITNQDYCYSDIYMTKDEFEKFKEWITKK